MTKPRTQYRRGCRLQACQKQPIASFFRSRGATTAVEFALVAPAFFAIIFGIEEIARLCWTRMALQHAVELAARCAVINQTNCGKTSQITAYAASQALGVTVPSADFAVPTAANCSGKEVQGTYIFTSLVPQLVPVNVTLQVQSCYP
jgi:Flp pilus assembly protein TadG